MDNFQSILAVIGIIAIVVVSIHGFLVHKKEQHLQLDALTDAKKDILSSPRGSHKVTKAFEPQNTNDLTNLDNMDLSTSRHDENDDVYQAEKIKDTNAKNEDETVQNNDQVAIANAKNKQTKATEATEVTEVTEATKGDVFIFNVVAKEGEELSGHALLQYFLTSGFRFGERSIFHRHERSDGTGPILFSIANMMMPGTFDLDSIEQFKSKGVSFFLTAPNDDIDIKASFKMMLTAVEIMAEEFDCIVLNSQRNVFTQEQFIGYQDRLAQYDVATPVLTI